MSASSALLPIIAHARAGALEHAWRLFREAGLEGVTDDAAVLSVKGRLLKDRGRQASGEARRAFYAQAAEAYGAAGAIGWATYPLINAATLSLLAGEPERAAALAARVLARIEAGEEDEPDTPYWRGATLAEAQLLLGRTHEAWLALREAMALAPHAWEDHASTLRQFGLILETQGQDAAWLEPLRPPRALHFAGHMGADPNDAELAGAVRDILARERVGFGYGALAAGADILIAQALLDHGAELHLVLPVGREAFRAASVEPFGEGWTARYDAILARADTVVSVGPAGGAPGPLGLELAARSAMGRAAMQARVLATEAIQLVVPPPEGGPASDGGSAWAAQAWQEAGRRGLSIAAARAIPLPAGAGLADPADARLAAILMLAPDEAVGDEGLVDGLLPGLWPALAAAGAAPTGAPAWTGSALLLAFETCALAARAAAAAAPLLGQGRIAGAYGLARSAPSAYGPAVLLGRPLETAQRLLASVPPGGAYVTAEFATTLCAGPKADGHACEPVGELPPRDPAERGGDGDLSVFSLRLGRS
jgi:hypothetical protein